MLDKQMEIVADMQKLTKDTWDMMKLQMELGRTRSTSVQSAEAAYYSVLTQSASLKGQIRDKFKEESNVPRYRLCSLSKEPLIRIWCERFILIQGRI